MMFAEIAFMVIYDNVNEVRENCVPLINEFVGKAQYSFIFYYFLLALKLFFLQCVRVCLCAGNHYLR